MKRMAIENGIAWLEKTTSSFISTLFVCVYMLWEKTYICIFQGGFQFWFIFDCIYKEFPDNNKVV